MEDRERPLFYLCNALQSRSLCCSALSVFKKNEGGTNKATAVEPNQHLLCQQRAVAPKSVQAPRHTHTQSLGLESSKEMPRNKGQVVPTRNLIASSWGDGRGERQKNKEKNKEGKRKANNNEKSSHSLSETLAYSSTFPWRQSSTGFSVPRSTPGIRTAIPLGREEEKGKD